MVTKVGDPTFIALRRQETITPGASSERVEKQYFFYGLIQGTEYSFHANLHNAFGTTVSPVQRLFLDFTKPELIGITIESVSRSNVVLLVQLRPGGLQTNVHASIVPADSAHVPAGPGVAVAGSADGAIVTAAINHFLFLPNTEYKARLTLSNPAGTTVSPEVRFTTLP